MPKYLIAALLVAAALTVLIGMSATDAFAVPCTEILREYYDNAAHDNLVGERIILCDGTVYQWGVKTPYAVTTAGDDCGNC